MDALGVFEQTPLHEACSHPHPEIVALLLRRGANANHRHVCGWSPLHYACVSGGPDVRRMLLQSGAEVDARNAKGETPLRIACRYKNEPAVRFLLDRGADPNAKDNFGTTPLYCACKRSNQQIIDALVAKGAKAIPLPRGVERASRYQIWYEYTPPYQRLVEHQCLWEHARLPEELMRITDTYLHK